MVCHQRRMASTAKAAVSWSVPTLIQACWRPGRRRHTGSPTGSLVDREVVHQHPLGLARRAQLLARVAERPDELLLLGVDGDDGLAEESWSSTASLMCRNWASRSGWAVPSSALVGLEAVAQLVEQLGHDLVADAVALARSSAARLRTLRVVQRSGDSASPRVPGSISASRSARRLGRLHRRAAATGPADAPPLDGLAGAATSATPRGPSGEAPVARATAPGHPAHGQRLGPTSSPPLVQRDTARRARWPPHQSPRKKRLSPILAAIEPETSGSTGGRG